MKQIVVLLALLPLLFTGCAEKQISHESGFNSAKQEEARKTSNEKVASVPETTPEESVEEQIIKQLPPPAEGLKWAVFKGVAIQHPVNWHEYAQGNTYTSSVESVPENGIFETGLTVQILRDVEKKNPMGRRNVVGMMLKMLEEDKDNTKLLATLKDHEDMESIVYRYRNAPANMTPIIVHKYFQVSKVKDFVNIITFETTEAQWEEYWLKYGEPMLGLVANYDVK